MNWRLMFLADLALMFFARFIGQDNPKQISMVDSRSSAIWFPSLSYIPVFFVYTFSLALIYDYV